MTATDPDEYVRMSENVCGCVSRWAERVRGGGKIVKFLWCAAPRSGDGDDRKPPSSHVMLHCEPGALRTKVGWLAEEGPEGGGLRGPRWATQFPACQPIDAIPATLNHDDCVRASPAPVSSIYFATVDT